MLTYLEQATARPPDVRPSRSSWSRRGSGRCRSRSPRRSRWTSKACRSRRPSGCYLTNWGWARGQGRAAGHSFAAGDQQAHQGRRKQVGGDLIDEILHAGLLPMWRIHFWVAGVIVGGMEGFRLFLPDPSRKPQMRTHNDARSIFRHLPIYGARWPAQLSLGASNRRQVTTRPVAIVNGEP